MTTRRIPGTEIVEGREFRYVECSNDEEFDDLFPEIAGFGNSPLPKAGGMISENVRLILPDGKTLYGLSYKGDIDGWGQKISAYCSEHGLLWGAICNDAIRLPHGKVIPLKDCETFFY
jgi:hypothetical protein